ncbi:MAG TPA: hypothetical protein PK747_07860 [Acidobacteriota bacterium]|jgi:predicted RNA-binding Zn-ribbon protein involved in translation (DUF1610 family)|nr:hypothetical protein [Acidobacteriota bacterium]HNT18151.1 hypothetical protein [Acidobacteriota bacterium]HPA27016.1 hypothetical protein [Acidobacteriota bacterium]HQO20408.1 hypothetical protein [Acidobacteriota bacterium]HQQ47306.1 hypothetical protein [Acidobacteriota bacterium]
MRGNICPKCGKAVMTYGDFFWKHQPYKRANCSNCGVELSRSRKVLFLIPSFVLFALILVFATVYVFAAGVVPKGLALFSALILFVSGAFLTNYLGFAAVGWKAKEK